jgi:hypothetical protein
VGQVQGHIFQGSYRNLWCPKPAKQQHVSHDLVAINGSHNSDAKCFQDTISLITVQQKWQHSILNSIITAVVLHVLCDSKFLQQQQSSLLVPSKLG